jgi:selenocysteine lyase/cysteine desulfurase
LTGWLLDNLVSLHHGNGAPSVRVYGPTDLHMRGATVSMNFYDPKGVLIDHRKIEARASKANISLRAGCFCNPGAGEVAHGLTKAEMDEGFKNEERMTFEQFLTVLERTGGKSAGAVRISLGLASNFADVYRFMQFAQGFLNKDAPEL